MTRKEEATAVTRSARLWNRYARGYARRPIADPATYARKLAQTQALLRPDMRLLEFGCGSGATARAHAPFVAHIDAIDYSEAMIAIAVDAARAEGVANVAFHTCAVEDWVAQDASYDMILGLSVLHLVEDRAQVLESARKMLKPGGYLVTSTACLSEMGALVGWLLPMLGRTGLVPRLGVMSEAQHLEEIRAAGFEIIDHWKPAPRTPVFAIARAH